MLKLQSLFEMANLYPEDTGLPVTVWISPKDNTKHGPRIKVCNHPGPNMTISDTFSISIEETPKIISGKCKLDSKKVQNVNDWIKLNRKVLLDFWDGSLSSKGAITKLKLL